MTHYFWGYGQWGANYPFFGIVAALGPLIVLVMLWSLFWKGLALWHSARRGQYWWFLALLIINTVGILEIVYLFVFARLKWSELFDFNREHHPHSH